jgi:hypothetical protein
MDKQPLKVETCLVVSSGGSGFSSLPGASFCILHPL